MDSALPALTKALTRGHGVLTAPPGSGKTTRVPPLLLPSHWLDGNSIIMLEPRRPAARMAAARMADLMGTTVGETVGYQVRYERRIGPRTRIQVLTEGILTRRIQCDPELKGVGLLIFDEFHERSLQADLGLALALDAAAALRPDLRILIMSATLDAQAAADLLGGAPIIRAEGHSYPVEVRYADSPVADPQRGVESAVRQALGEQEGDLLVFLPGVGEIERTGRHLNDTLGDRLDWLPLHGTLPVEQQQLALVRPPGGRRRVLLSTDIAETSVTIEGITTVVDCGLARKPRFDPGSGLTRLVTEPIPLASADQRAGRAGRLCPGVCYRLWTRGQEVGRAPHRRAEILDADLAPLALDLALWGLHDTESLRWLDPPPPHNWRQAVALLQDLGALDAAGAITPLGRELADLPLHPRLAVMLVAGRTAGAGRLAAGLAALLSERDGWMARPGDPRPADLGLRLAALNGFRQGRRPSGMAHSRLAATDRLSRRLLSEPGTHRRSMGAVANPAPATSPGALLALAYPDRIAQRRSERSNRYLLAGGVGADLPLDDALSVHPYLVAADLDVRGREARIRLALPIEETTLRSVLSERIRCDDVLLWDTQLEAVTARRETRLGALLLDSQAMALTREHAGPTLELLLDQIERRFDQVLPWDPPARQLRARVALVRAQEPTGDWPDLSDDTLRRTLRDWLAPWLEGKRSLAEVGALHLDTILIGQLEWPQRSRLDEMAPETLTTPAGNRRRLDYLAGPEPVLPVPVQELFGTGQTPAVCHGRVPVMLHLLSPAGRPVQITRDLQGFWSGSYREVRKEMRGRYPKHSWPEDPLTAAPITRTTGGCRR